MIHEVIYKMLFDAILHIRKRSQSSIIHHDKSSQRERIFLHTETSTIHYNYEYDVHIIIERVLIDTEQSCFEYIRATVPTLKLVWQLYTGRCYELFHIFIYGFKLQIFVSYLPLQASFSEGFGQDRCSLVLRVKTTRGVERLSRGLFTN